MIKPAHIGIENADGTVDFVRCYDDCSPAQAGKLLVKHWRDRDAVEKMIALGNLSRIGSEIGEAHLPFHQAYPDYEAWQYRYGQMCEFYQRDWYDGHSHQDGPWRLASVNAFIRNFHRSSDMAFCYVLRNSSSWYFASQKQPGQADAFGNADHLRPLPMDVLEAKSPERADLIRHKALMLL